MPACGTFSYGCLMTALWSDPILQMSKLRLEGGEVAGIRAETPLAGQSPWAHRFCTNPSLAPPPPPFPLPFPRLIPTVPRPPSFSSSSLFFKAVVLNQSRFCSPGTTWQSLETFFGLSQFGKGVLQAPGEWTAGKLLSAPLCTGGPPRQRAAWPKMSVGLRLRDLP